MAEDRPTSPRHPVFFQIPTDIRFAPDGFLCKLKGLFDFSDAFQNHPMFQDLI